MDLKELRVLLDEAITYDDRSAALKYVEDGYRLARERELLGEMMYFKAQREIIDGDFSVALKYLDLAIKHNPCDGAAFNDRALCMIEMGILEGVMEFFDKGIEVEPDYATIHHNKGWFLNKLGQHQEALKCYHQALAIEPNRAVTYENMANAYENAGCMKEALWAYKKAFELVKSSYQDIRQQIQERIRLLEKKAH